MNSNTENLIGCFTTFFEHGLLLIEDTETTADHQGWNPETQHVHFDADSLYLAVRPAVDGPVTVCVYRDEAPPDALREMSQCFDGEFVSRLGIVRLRDPDDKVSLAARGQSGVRHVRVFVDKRNWSSRVVVAIS